MVGSYSRSAANRAIVIATVIAGTLDILSAFAFAIAAGGSPVGVLRGICGAIVDPDLFPSPIVPELAAPLAPILIGLALHFALMTVMAAVYVSSAAHLRWLNRVPVLSGLAYGFAVWLVMFWLVLPLRWPTLFPTSDSSDIEMQLFSHLLLVGVPIAFITARAARWRSKTIASDVQITLAIHSH